MVEQIICHAKSLMIVFVLKLIIFILLLYFVYQNEGMQIREIGQLERTVWGITCVSPHILQMQTNFIKNWLFFKNWQHRHVIYRWKALDPT